MWDLIQGKPFNVQAFAEALEREAQEYVKWEHLKLRWLQEHEPQDEASEAERVAA